MPGNDHRFGRASPVGWVERSETNIGPSVVGFRYAQPNLLTVQKAVAKGRNYRLGDNPEPGCLLAVVARSPDRATSPTVGLQLRKGRPSVRIVAWSGDRATTVETISRLSPNL